MKIADYGFALLQLPSAYANRHVGEVEATVYGERIIIVHSEERPLFWHQGMWSNVILNGEADALERKDFS